MLTATKPMDTEIINLQSYGAGYMWDVRGIDIMTQEDVTLSYRTSKRGEGLWETRSNGDESQLQGLLQFRLSANRDTARRQIKRYFGVGE